jgi:hypothetical protein
VTIFSHVGEHMFSNGKPNLKVSGTHVHFLAIRQEGIQNEKVTTLVEISQNVTILFATIYDL